MLVQPGECLPEVEEARQRDHQVLWVPQRDHRALRERVPQRKTPVLHTLWVHGVHQARNTLLAVHHPQGVGNLRGLDVEYPDP